MEDFDFIVCGAGAAGSVIAGRLSEDPAVRVLLIDAGGSADIDQINDPRSWPSLRQSEQNWMFRAAANQELNGRTIPMAMGKVLGGGTSINVMVWARGHMSDWDDLARDVGDQSWNYASVLKLYRRIENWHGRPDCVRRGWGGPLFVQSAPSPHPLALAGLDAFAKAGIPIFQEQNGEMMEGSGGASITEICVRDGKRQTSFGAYVEPHRARTNLVVETGALISRLIFDGTRVTGIEYIRNGVKTSVTAQCETIVSLGAIHTPKLLMQSGIGDEAQLKRFGIPVIVHLPGVGQNFQDHPMAPCVWEASEPIEGRNNLTEVTALWSSRSGLDRPDMQSLLVERGYASPEAAKEGLPSHCWSMTTALLRPESRGQIVLTGSRPEDPVVIQTNFLKAPEDRRAIQHCIEFCREVGNSLPLKAFTRREILPGSANSTVLDHFIRNGTVSHSHQSCTAKMGRDSMSVVDGELRVYGVEGLRVADASVLSRVTTGNTMAPSMIIGERAADILRSEYELCRASPNQPPLV